MNDQYHLKRKFIFLWFTMRNKKGKKLIFNEFSDAMWYLVNLKRKLNGG